MGDLSFGGGYSDCMHVLDPADTEAKPGSPDYFTGAVALRNLDTPGADPVKLIRVEFPAGARTNWHTHSGVQVLVVLVGRCRFQRWGGPVGEACLGEMIYVPPGEMHWHGATPDSAMVHLAVNIALETEWLEEVTEEQHRDRP